MNGHRRPGVRVRAIRRTGVIVDHVSNDRAIDFA